ncbi:hypothetical protein L345_16783, partial [Ophiophagus hannah]
MAQPHPRSQHPVSLVSPPPGFWLLRNQRHPPRFQRPPVSCYEGACSRRASSLGLCSQGDATQLGSSSSVGPIPFLPPQLSPPFPSDARENPGDLRRTDFKMDNDKYLDFQNYVLRGSVHGISALERAITLFNSISQWVQVMILKRPTPQQRAEVFTKFIHVTQKLRQLQNFNTLMAIVGGLCHSTIARLKETHALLPSEVAKVLAEMTELLSSSGNYGAYRRAYADCKDFKIPIVGVHLKDLVTLHEALPDRVEGGRLNLSKLQSLYEPVWEFRMRQRAQPPFEANKDLVHLLTDGSFEPASVDGTGCSITGEEDCSVVMLSLDLYYSEEEIYALSYSREPRCLKMLEEAQIRPLQPHPLLQLKHAAENKVAHG